jgi:hypothetical protein
MSFTGSTRYPDTFRKIETRLRNFSPPIELREHIVDNPTTIADLETHPLTLQGVDFSVKNPDKFLFDVRSARTGTDKAFAEGSTKPSDWKQHWSMTASLLATRGIGFREPWRYYLNDRGTRLRDAQPPRLNAPEMDRGFAANFGEANTVNLSALHISVAFGKWTECNIHIDETGIAMADPRNNLSITPNVINHTFNELLLKTIAAERLHLPTWFTDRFNLHVLSPEMGYKKLGVSVDVLKGDSYKLTISASCGLTSCQDIEFSKILKLDSNALKSLNPTINLTGKFNLGGG